VSSQADKFAQAAKQGDPVAPVPGRGWKYYARRIVIYLVAAYVILCVGLFVFQKRFVYHAAHEDSVSPQDNGFAKAQAKPIELQTSDGVTLKGWHVAGRGKGEPATLDLSHALLVDLYFCGNAGNRADRVSTFRRLASLGVSVVCFDYRGYGDSGGAPDEEALAKDARAIWDFLRSRNVPPERIVLHGESLGGAVAIRLAAELCAEKTPPAALITESTFPRLKDVAGRQFWFVPTALILQENYPSIERMPGVSCPLLMFHGTFDSLVPLAMGKQLFDAAPAQSQNGTVKQFVILPTAGHNDVGGADTNEYMAALSTFVNNLAPELSPVRSEKPRKPHEKKTPPSTKPVPPGAQNAPPPK
jgi:pimeloyl-ACP methyl ester carboxylesterase